MLPALNLCFYASPHGEGLMFRAMMVKEILLVLRDKHALAALFIMPSVFILIMSIALKDTFSGSRPLLNYALVDRDNSVSARQLARYLSAGKELVFHDIDIPDATEKRQLLTSDLQIIVTIPAGFARALTTRQSGPLLRLDVAADTKQEALAVFKARLALDILRLRLAAMAEKSDLFTHDEAAQAERRGHTEAELFDLHFCGIRQGKKPTSTQQSVPSWIVFGMFFVVIPMSTVFINERRQNTLQRMAAMNISIPVLFAGKIIPYILINQIQMLLMIGVGIFLVPVFGGTPLTPGHSVIGLGMVSLTLSLAAIGSSLLIAVLAATVEQATTIGGLLNILFGAIGGVMVPKFYMPAGMRALAALSPMSWGLDGFLDVFLRGLGAKDVIVESFALAVFGIVLICIAAILLQMQMKRGR